MSAGLRSTSTITPDGTPVAGVVVHAAVTAPLRSASKSIAGVPNSRGWVKVQVPTELDGFVAVAAPTVTREQLRTNAARSRLPHAVAVASVTASAGLSSAATA